GAVLGVPGWRFALWLYCGFGLVIAVFFWLVVRDTPAEHPACAAESASDSSPSRAPLAAPPLGLAEFVRSRNLALFSLVQFGTNVGWAFLITQLPTFLTERFGVSESSRGAMASVPAWVSCVGLLLGGFVTDALARRLGVRRGRAWPIGAMMLVAAAAYLLCPLVRDPWSFVAMMALMGLAVDLANPSIWSFAQDVGGRHAGAVLGWGNMWGNIGAALSPVLLGAVKRAWGWDAAFFVAAVCFALAALAAFSLDASRTLRFDRV
ncbi:MAG TPA: MFS transporter, partial [Planctomycetia bacterium]|nr:MFS transporter [Planctomycetia bacterium]